MKTLIVILTRLYIEEGKEKDEFKNFLDSNKPEFIPEDESEIAELLIIHGHNKRFISEKPFEELVTEIRKHFPAIQQAFLFYHSGNERIMKVISDISNTIDGKPFADGISYSIEGGLEDDHNRGKIIVELYKAIIEDNKDLIDNRLGKLLKCFQPDLNAQTVFKLVNALCNLPYTKNLDEVVKLISADNHLAGMPINETPVIEYIRDNYTDCNKMKQVAVYVKEKYQHN